MDKENPDFFPVEIYLAENFKEYSLVNSEKKPFHEAGYDAFVTGFVFARLYYALSIEEQSKAKNSIFLTKTVFYFKNGNLSHSEPWYKKVI
jgi:hypothetical protein